MPSEYISGPQGRKVDHVDMLSGGNHIISTKFEYLPLQDPSTDIRVVSLASGPDSSPVRCSLLNVSKSDAPKYEALSYTWGDAIDRRQIILNGQEFGVTKNLEAALRNLRHENVNDPSRILWIDAICINQQDDAEKSSQVGRMTTIYINASSVAIWLGTYSEPEDELHSSRFDRSFWEPWNFSSAVGTKHSTKKVFELVRHLGKYLWRNLNVPDRLLDHLNKAIRDYDIQIWSNLKLLLQRTWFERLWVVQEFAVSRVAHFICGRVSISWQDFANAAYYLEHAKRAILIALSHDNRGALPMFILDLSSLRPLKIKVADEHRRSMICLMTETAFTKATDPRDRIYALVGICDESQNIQIDYSRSWEEVYRDWTWQHILTSGEMKALNLCTDSSRTSLPSWVPDLRNQFRGGVTRGIFRTDSSGSPIYAAATGTKPDPKLSDDRSRLSLSSIDLDLILIMLESSNAIMDRLHSGPANIDTENSEVVNSWENSIVHHFKSMSAPPTDLYSLLPKALFGGSEGEFGRRDDSVHDRVDRYAVWRGHCPIPDDFNPNLSSPTRMKSYLGGLLHDLRVAKHYSTPFITMSGRVGAIKNGCNIVAGDHIRILLGAQTPFIVRKDEARDGYRLMGPCYVPDVMNGEAIEALKSCSQKIERITLV